jgi:UDP-glucose 4-epimerase
MNNKTVLITGASGFLGTWLADALFESGYELIGVDLRAPLKPRIWANFMTASTDNADWENLIGGKSLHAVYHLAGGASVALSVSDPYSDFSNLLPGTARMALYLVKHHPQARFIFFSSAAVYGNVQILPTNEDVFKQPISPYGVHKYLAESLLEDYSRIYNLNVTVLRIFSVYGPGLRKQLIWDVSNRALQAKADGQTEIELFGTGAETRDFIYVKDLCDSIISLLKLSPAMPYEVLNMASGVEISIKEIADCILKHLNVGITAKFDGQIPKGDPFNMKADVTRLSEKQISMKYNLDNGIKEVTEWVIKQQLS